MARAGVGTSVRACEGPGAVRQQLLGGGRDAISYWGLGEDRFPLREYLSERGLLDPAVNNNR